MEQYQWYTGAGVHACFRRGSWRKKYRLPVHDGRSGSQEHLGEIETCMGAAFT